MPAKCARCGVETNVEASFFKGRKSFSPSVQTYCPTCWLKRQHSVAQWVLIFSLGVGALGILFWLIWPGAAIGRVFTNLFLFQIFSIVTILPHELGHAWMARWLGMRVLKIYVGSGRTLRAARLFGFDVEFRAVPIGGLVLGTHPTLDYVRAKQFAFVFAGPAANLLLGFAVLPFLEFQQLWSFEPLEQGLQPGLMFFYANLAVLIENLWPHNVMTPFGAIPSDGKQLFLAFLLSPEKRRLLHSTNFVMEASVCYQKGEYRAAQTWLEKGLTFYPNNESLLNLEGVVSLELQEYSRARECFLKVVHQGSEQPLMRPLIMNNIAYANALMGGDDLLKEADALSQEAMTAASWVPAIRGTRGAVLAAMGRLEEALPLLHGSMAEAELPSHKAQNACLIAEAEFRRGNLDAAQTYLAEARKLDPKCSLLSRAAATLRERTPSTA